MTRIIKSLYNGYAVMQEVSTKQMLSRDEGLDEISKPKFKLMSIREVLAEIKAIGEGVQELELRIQTCMIQCLAHAEAHGDVTLLEKLVRVLPEGRWNNGVKQWIMRNSPIRTDSNGKFHQLKEKDKGYRPYTLEAAATDIIVPKQRSAAKAAQERSFSLVDINKIPEQYKARIERAKQENSNVVLIEEDEKKMLKTLNAFQDVIDELGLKPTKVITEDGPKKVKTRLISKKTLMAKKVIKKVA